MIPSPKKPNLAMSALYAAPGMCDNLHSMKPAVLVTKRIFPEAIAYLKEHAELDYAESDDGMSAGELAARIRGKQAVVSQLMDKFSPEVLASLDGIKVIANVAVGYDNICLPGATRLGIMVTHTPDVLTDTTADFAFTLLMAAARRVVEGHHFVHSGQWTRWRGGRRAFRCASFITIRGGRRRRWRKNWGWSRSAPNSCCGRRIL